MGRQKKMTIRPTYGAAVRWVAATCEVLPTSTTTQVASTLHVQLVASLFGAQPHDVALDAQGAYRGKRFLVKPNDA